MRELCQGNAVCLADPQMSCAPVFTACPLWEAIMVHHLGYDEYSTVLLSCVLVPYQQCGHASHTVLRLDSNCLGILTSSQEASSHIRCGLRLYAWSTLTMDDAWIRACRRKILETEISNMKEKVAVVLEKTQNDDKLIAALKSEVATLKKSAGQIKGPGPA